MKSLPSKEKLLAQKLKEKDKDAINYFITHYRRSIQLTIFKIVKNEELAKDLTQEVLTKIISNIHQYDEDHVFGGWVYRIAVHHAIDHLRKRKLKTVSLDHPLNKAKAFTAKASLSSSPSPPEHPFSTDLYNEVEAILKALPETYRNILVMYYFKEMSYKEIAQEIGMSMGTVKSQLHRAKKKFTELYYKRFQDKG